VRLSYKIPIDVINAGEDDNSYLAEITGLAGPGLNTMTCSFLLPQKEATSSSLIRLTDPGQQL